MKTTSAWLMVSAALVLLPLAVWVEADDDRYAAGRTARGPDIAPVANDAYRAACGDCHIAYAPGLLPARSWTAMMNGLSDHFGDNAELPDAERAAVQAYLESHAADRQPSKASRELLSRLPADAVPLRISELPGFRREHREIPARLIQDNDKVRSLSQCQACHTQAEGGYFDEHGVVIPGAGRWED